MKPADLAAPSMPRSDEGSQYLILYFSVHEVLEYDDLLMFTSLGHRVFSLGVYREPGHGVFRSPPDRFFQPELAEAFRQQGLTKAFVAGFDVVVVNHDISLVATHADVFADTPVVYRTIGQSNLAVEAEIARWADRIRIVRYSVREVGRAGFARTDAVIYFAKDPGAYPAWTGSDVPITNHNHYALRDYACVPAQADYRRIVEGTGATLYGMGNDAQSNWGGLLDADALIERYRRCACYVYVWTFPPSYTLSLVEAMLVGAPVIAPSLAFVMDTRLKSPFTDHADFGRVRDFDPARYEVADLLGNADALVYDSIGDARDLVANAGERDPETLRAAAATRETARATFGMAAIGRQWNTLFAAMVAER